MSRAFGQLDTQMGLLLSTSLDRVVSLLVNIVCRSLRLRMSPFMNPSASACPSIWCLDSTMAVFPFALGADLSCPLMPIILLRWVMTSDAGGGQVF